MKKKIFFGVSIAAFLLTSCGGSGEETTGETTDSTAVEEAAPVTYTVDTESSVIHWMSYMLGEGDSLDHSGTVLLSGGSVTVDGELISAGEVEMDMTSIKEDSGMEKLEGHLKNEDFFNVAAFATSSFIMDRHENGMVYGKLSVLEMSMDVEAPVEMVVDENGITLNVSLFKLNMAELPFYIEDVKQPAEEQHNPVIGFTATIVAH